MFSKCSRGTEHRIGGRREFVGYKRFLIEPVDVVIRIERRDIFIQVRKIVAAAACALLRLLVEPQMNQVVSGCRRVQRCDDGLRFGFRFACGRGRNGQSHCRFGGFIRSKHKDPKTKCCQAYRCQYNRGPENRPRGIRMFLLHFVFILSTLRVRSYGNRQEMCFLHCMMQFFTVLRGELSQGKTTVAHIISHHAQRFFHGNGIDV